MRTLFLLSAVSFMIMAGAGCSSNKTGADAASPDAWKKTAPPADYIAQAKAHNAAAPPPGGGPPAAPAPR